MFDSIKISNSKSQSENAKDRRDAVNQAVTESSENFEVVMTQDFQSIQNRYQGGMEEHERRVAELIESEARDAPRCQRSNLLHEHPVLLSSRRKRRKVREKPDALGAAVTHCVLSKILT